MLFKEPDRTAPRFTNTSYNILNRAFFLELREKNSNLKKYSNKQITNIIKETNKEIWNNVIKNKNGVELESMIGYIFIGSCQKMKECIDIYASVKYGKKIQHRNLDTDGNVAKIFYTNNSLKYKFKFQNLWKFEPCRNFTVATSKYYKKNWRNYISIPKNFKVHNLFVMLRKKSKDYADNNVEMYGFK